MPPLHDACNDGDISAIRTLAAEGADLDMAMDGGYTAIYIATCHSIQNKPAALRAMVEVKADVNTTETDDGE